MQEFQSLIAEVTDAVGDHPLNGDLAAYLDEHFPAGDEWFEAVRDACHRAIEQGWMCNREAGGIRFGRVLDPSPELNDFSVDVVQMNDIKGPHHSHPGGEIDMVMPVTPGAQFDGHGEGWCVYPPGSAHYPTVTGGEALVLYLLPGGQIKFTR